jgi:hypothetical protein
MTPFPTAWLCCASSLFCAAIAPGPTQQPRPALARSNPAILGVLEDGPGKYEGAPYTQGVRAVFQKVGRQWKPFPTHTDSQQSLKTLTTLYPQQVTWTIGFDGKDIGQVTTRRPDNFKWYADIGIEGIISPGRIPTVGTRHEKFSGWIGAPVFRPLVAVSHPSVADPENWKPTTLSPEQVDSMRRLFRAKFPMIKNCRNPEENIPRPWKYSDEDIQIRSAYSSNESWTLVETGLNSKKDACDFVEEDGGPYDGGWYLLEPGAVPRFLGFGMWLLDAGDYDGDGKSEVLFVREGYNRGGYRLYYADFTQSAEFTFSYH